MADYLLGIDAGTSVVKAALFDREGRELGSAAHRTTLKSPRSGWVEVSMDETWQRTVDAVRAVLAQTSIPAEQIAAVGVTGNMVGAWLVDTSGAPVRDAILHNDGRTQSLIDQLSEEHPGFMSEIYQHSGSVMQQGCTLPVIRWLKDNEPDVLARAAVVLNCKDWLNYKLTGTQQVDPTEASVMPGDTRTRTYSEPLFNLLGIRDQRHLFPPVRPSDAIVGEIHAEAAAATGLRAGTPVVAGAGDVPAAALGAGAVEPGTAATALGTALLNGLVVDAPIFEPVDVGLLFCVPGNLWLRTMVNISGTTNLDWAIAQFCGLEREQAARTGENLFVLLEALLEQSEPGARGIIYHPYIQPVGVIAPFVEPAARAQFFNVAVEHTRADLLRAVYEGVALSIRDCYNAIPTTISEIRLTGGGARSALWSQMIADCTGKRVVIPVGTEFGAKGAALLAAVGVGWYHSIIDAAQQTRGVARIYEPDAAVKEVYDASYDIYTTLRDDLRPVWRRNNRRLQA